MRVTRWTVIFKCGENYHSFSNRVDPKGTEGFAPDKIWMSENTPKDIVDVCRMRAVYNDAEIVVI